MHRALAGKTFFDGIAVGAELPRLTKSITKKQLFLYSASTWDCHPGHYDTAFARSQGFPDVYLDGPMNAAFMAQLLTDWMGSLGSLRKLNVTYRRMAFPGDVLTCSGKIVGKSEADEVRRVTCELALENQGGEIVAQGTAEIAF